MRVPILILITIGAVVAPKFGLGWGWDVHRLINRSATTHLPQEFALFGQWASELEELSIAADERKCCVEGESIKHYIDIDDYPEFATGELPHTYDEMVTMYGTSRVEGNGTVPWAIEASYHELVSSFQERDWEAAIVVAADLGHYVADLHSPLHLTLNYNGQLTGQGGIHARHESEMTARNLEKLEPDPGVVDLIADPLESVFAWIDIQYPGVEQILGADLEAKAFAGGSTSNDAYFNRMWELLGEETSEWVRRGSIAVASLWYAAWVEAGSPTLPGSATASEADPPEAFETSVVGYPNPSSVTTTIRVRASRSEPVELAIFDLMGRRVRYWVLSPRAGTTLSVLWDGLDQNGSSVAGGVYQLVLRSPNGSTATGRAVIIR